tara:strand:- start:164 stop:400 length:237 start_codon:yes stop_codon:yes gene_type:complete
MQNKDTQTEEYELSNQALGSIMMALQECLLNQLDIVPILQGFKFTESDNGLVVTNPPTVRFTDNSEITAADLENMAKK